MKISVKSDKGLLREKNEDSVQVINGKEGIPVTFIIADGMGGHNSGEIASRLAVNYVADFIAANPAMFLDESVITDSIKTVMNNANDFVYTSSIKEESNYGMGTTLIVAVLLNNRMYIGHVGDSRVYIIREGNIKKITTDHTYIEELVRNGSLTREQAEKHPKRNIITRSIGCSEEVLVDTYYYEVEEDDVFIFCTDGLTNMLCEEEIKSIILENEDPEVACNELIRRANEEGGEDNITVILFKNCK